MNNLNLKIVLVEPKNPINIGSVARVMDNFGFTQLVIVSSEKIDLEQASISACWASELLKNTLIFSDMLSAVGECQKVIGFSTKSGKDFPKVEDFYDLSQQLLQEVVQTKIALVFGPEDTGLTKQHLSYVTDLACIKTNPKNPSLNLSHAVAVVLSELSKKAFTQNSNDHDSSNDTKASLEQLKNLESLIDKMCLSTEFYNKNTSANLPQIVGNIFRRSSLTKRELSILEGIFGKAYECKKR